MFIITEQQHLLLQKLAQTRNNDKQRLISKQSRSLRPSLFLNDINSIVDNSFPTIQQQKQVQHEELSHKPEEIIQISSEREYIKLPKIGRFSKLRKSTQTEVNEFQFLSQQNSPIRNNQDTQQLEKKYFSKTPLKNTGTLLLQGNQSTKKKSVKFNPQIETINEAGLIGREYIEITQRQSRFKKQIVKLHTQVN
ncbi:unnamed protein product (macronuclear) [Paramecium tetraurelia]|uniref:Uncharacterized protein n=1 Tax=Paramecium tetraurelia TaxID=5888 RepID=A0BUQ4_PARTE|nr:uncharacterized protein GSPATT00005517001 [Paramecium tetraurelia]CAK62271.1 unnamed protein product [Paramecium tetraurelia]|eukprot:XP_001429669.1 hypothetical protein (macronuclear) [Paramecium tetraurelia strain d4-2]